MFIFMANIRDLQPRLVWEQFDDITRVPRPSKKEEKIINYLIDFAEKHSLEYKRDKIGNVVIRKAATKGYEQRPTVILQSHMDMVCEKNSDVVFDFDSQPIRTHIEDGWVRAEGTTLGADCGIGMAAALAMLIDQEVEHIWAVCVVGGSAQWCHAIAFAGIYIRTLLQKLAHQFGIPGHGGEMKRSFAFGRRDVNICPVCHQQVGHSCGGI